VDHLQEFPEELKDWLVQIACGRHVQEGKNTSFELASKNLGMAPEAVRAGKLLDAALESQNMSVDETGYFNILVNVFSQVGYKVNLLRRR
jgi:hypothetical protein